LYAFSGTVFDIFKRRLDTIKPDVGVHGTAATRAPDCAEKIIILRLMVINTSLKP
jgi:hypothetical protein